MTVSSLLTDERINGTLSFVKEIIEMNRDQLRKGSIERAIEEARRNGGLVVEVKPFEQPSNQKEEHTKKQVK